jgi:transposase
VMFVAHASNDSNNAAQSIEALRSVIEARDAENKLLKLVISKLQMQLAKSRCTQFGSTSERFDDAQGTLIEAAPLDELVARKDSASAVVMPAANKPASDRGLPAHLPREEQVHRPQTTAAHRASTGLACGCSACGERLRRIGADVSEQLEYVPVRFEVIRHVRPKLACTKCDLQTGLNAHHDSKILGPLANQVRTHAFRL